MEQLDLWAQPPDDIDGYTPPDHIKPHQHLNGTGYGRGCRCDTCVTRQRLRAAAYLRGMRICRHCLAEYHPNEAPARAGVCPSCRSGIRLRGEPRTTPRADQTCARCATPYKSGQRQRWNLCPSCMSLPEFRVMMGRLGSHNAPIDIVLAVLDWPYCANEQCGAWLLEQGRHRRNGRHSYRFTYNYAIDHDHTCCPGEKSCGQCIRGIICRSCNNAMPHSLDALRAQGIVDYLTRS